MFFVMFAEAFKYSRKFSCQDSLMYLSKFMDNDFNSSVTRPLMFVFINITMVIFSWIINDWYFLTVQFL